MTLFENGLWMSMKATWILISLIFLLVACSPEAPTAPLGSSASTPVADLPVSIDFQATPRQQPTTVPDSIVQEADAEYLLLSNIYERTAPSIVNIEASKGTGVSRGSAFVYDTYGHFITNAHVVSNAAEIRVTFDDGYFTTAQLVGSDSYSDLAVLLIDVPASRLAPLTLVADSDTIRVGQRAISIGNPFGLSSSMTLGIVSGLGRTLRSAELIDENAPIGFQNPSIIQTDAPMNPGNSGGPLLNSQGEVMGVSTAIRSDSGVFQGVGFAVPANTVRRVVPSLIESGHVDYAWIGISVQPEENGFTVAALADELNLPVNQGVLVRGVTIGSPADEAGLRGGNRTLQVRGQSLCVGGDIIVAINGSYIANMDELATYLNARTMPDERVMLTVVRNQSTYEIPVILRTRPVSEGQVRDCTG
jgi:S1-C subfamily serine protease